MKEQALVDALVAQNIEARGGADAWQAVETLRITGQMDLGQGMHVPYMMDQKRPDKMCIEFEFDEKTAVSALLVQPAGNCCLISVEINRKL